jgi:protocatechuate 3,4-dioxygenase beta subunit
MTRFSTSRLVAAVALVLCSSPAFAGSISGRVLDPAGQPIAGAKVQWLPHRDEDHLAVDRASGKDPAPLGEAATDAQGRFRVVLDRPGAVSLRILPSGFSSVRLAGPFDASEDTGLDDLSVAPVKALAGTVVDEAGGPVASARVLVAGTEAMLEEDALHVAETRTAANGAFKTPEAPDGPRTITVVAPGFVPSTRVQIEPRAEERIVLARGGTVRGLVTDAAGKPSAGAIVLCEGLGIETDAAGGFRLAGIPPGVHSVVALRGEDLAARRDDVRIRKNEEVEIPLRLAKASAVTGLVVEEGTRRPLSGVRISINEAGRFLIGRSAAARRGRTDAKGRYRVGALSSRPYSVTASRDGYLPTTLPGVAASPAGGTGNIALRRAASVAGRVSDEKGQPVAGAHVRILRAGGMRAMIRRLGAGGNPRALLGGPAAVTGPDGSFRLKNLTPAHNLEIEATRGGYAPARQAGVTLKPGDAVKNVALQLRKGLEAHGRVLDSQGNPVAGAEIRAIVREPGPGGGVRAQMRFMGLDRDRPDAQTGPDGTFALRGMEEGQYTVSVSRDGFARKVVPSAEIKAAGENVWPPITLTTGAAIAGFIRDSAGQAIPGARIFVVDPGGAGPARPTDTGTDMEGRFRVDGLAPEHPLMLNISASGYATLQRNVTPPVSDLVIALKTAGVVRGRVEDADSKRPIPDFTIGRSGGRGGGPFQVVIGGAAGGDRAFHADDGSFELTEVPPGKWTVRASATGYRSADVAGVEVGEGETKEGVVLSLKRGGTVAGRVSDAGSGSAVANASVSWHSSESGGGPAGAFARLAGMGGGGGATTTDADGRFQLDGLPPGKVTVSASHPDYLDATRDIDPDKDASIELPLGSGATIAGTVVGRDGRSGVAGAQVSLNPEGDTSGRFSPDSARSDGSGNFLFDHLAGGRYQLVAQSSTGKTTMREVVVAENQRVDGVLLGMATGALLRGSVTGLPPGRLAGVRILAGAPNYSDQAVTDDSGGFVLNDVPSGQVRLQATTSFLSGRTTSKSIEVPEGAGEVPVEIAFEGASRLAGRVSRGDKPLGGLFVNANLMSGGGGGGSRSSAQTDESGQYTLEGLTDGDYMVSLGGQGVAYRKSFTVSGDTNGDIALPPIQVRGSVTDASTGEALEGVTVAIQSGAPGPGFAMKQGTTDSTGRYFIDDVDPGAYQATARRSGYQARTQPVTVSSDSVDANFGLQKGEGLSVTVVDGLTGLPLHGVTLAVFAGDGSVAFQGSLSLDSTGKGDVSSLGPGRYLAYFFSDGYAGRSAPVDVPSQNAAIAMTPGGRVDVHVGIPTQGQLVDASGQRYLLSPWRMDGQVNLAPPVTSWEHVAPGTYRLFAGPAGAQRPFAFTVLEGQAVSVDAR